MHFLLGSLHYVINALWKPDLYEQKDFERLVLFRNRAVNMQNAISQEGSAFCLLFSLLHCL